MATDPQSFRTAVKWIIGMIVVIGGYSIGFCLNQSSEAKEMAQSASDRASTISVVENEISHIRDDLNELKKVYRDVNDIRVTIAELAGDMRLTLEKVNSLQGAD